MFWYLERTEKPKNLNIYTKIVSSKMHKKFCLFRANTVRRCCLALRNSFENAKKLSAELGQGIQASPFALNRRFEKLIAFST